MARYSAGWRTAGAGSTTLPTASLYAGTSTRLLVREVHAFNTTTTAVALALRYLTTAGTQGAATITEMEWDGDGPAPDGAAFDTHTGGPTISTGNIIVADLGAAIGAGVIWTFDAEPIRIPTGTGNGVGICVLTGTGQILDVTFVWEE